MVVAGGLCGAVVARGVICLPQAFARNHLVLVHVAARRRREIRSASLRLRVNQFMACGAVRAECLKGA